MNIWEVKFAEKTKKNSAYFSSKSKADKFVLDNMSYFKVEKPIKHSVEKTKCKILKFLNRDNGLG
tara:strand:+ start:1417 stop:1611 length:195 start_codon:yes stop_codon:yes gene_type:complete